MQFDSFILLILVILLYYYHYYYYYYYYYYLAEKKNRSSVFEFNAYYLRLFLISFHFLFPRSSFMRK